MISHYILHRYLPSFFLFHSKPFILHVMWPHQPIINSNSNVFFFLNTICDIFDHIWPYLSHNEWASKSAFSGMFSLLLCFIFEKICFRGIVEQHKEQRTNLMLINDNECLLCQKIVPVRGNIILCNGSCTNKRKLSIS